MTPAAGASFGIRSLEVSYSEASPSGPKAEALGPPDFQAGSHPYQFTTNIAFNTTTKAGAEPVVEGSAKNVQIEFPPGVIGNSNEIPECPMAVFAKSGPLGEGHGCPAGTQVGEIKFNGESDPLYNLVPPAGVAGQLGTVEFVTPLVIDLSIRNGDYGLTAELRDISQVEEAKEISVALGCSCEPGPRLSPLRE